MRLSFSYDIDIPRDTTDKDLPEVVHKKLTEHFSDFKVILERIERDGDGNLISFRVGFIH